MFTDDVALEAELGIDSVKQMELLGKLEQQYRLSARPEDFRLSDYGTVGKITDFVLAALNANAAESDAAAPVTVASAPDVAAVTRMVSPQTAPAANSETLTRAALQAEIVALFAEAMEYPPEVFTEDVELEGELGIDSVKQMELLGKLEQRYRLPARPEDFRLSDYGTLRKITDFVFAAVNRTVPGTRARAPLYAVG